MPAIHWPPANFIQLFNFQFKNEPCEKYNSNAEKKIDGHFSQRHNKLSKKNKTLVTQKIHADS